jgi:hypothetical protein
MAARTMWLTLLAIGAMAVSGIGFAAFTASATSTTTAYAGNLSLSWNTATTQTPPAAASNTGEAYQTCGVSGLGTSALTVSTNYYAPGDWCWVTATVKNTGNVPTVYCVGTFSSGGSCIPAAVSVSSSQPSCWQSVGPTPATGVINPGSSSTTISWGIEVNDGVGNECQNSVGTLTFTVNAQTSTNENGEPVAAL